ncbi:MAG: flagellar hook-basal body protein [Lachnospiraceae bacterium]|nr:flagellar hook-basal body protein [Lachnospiraceae bacterium]
MLKGLYTAYTGMVQEQRRLDTITNNLANSNTAGFKKEGMVTRSFADEMAFRIKDTGDNLIPRRIGNLKMGVKIGETYTDWSQGPLKETLDVKSNMALQGPGFFAIEYTDKQGNTSIKYSRNGEFVVDKDGYLRTTDGDYVLNRDAATNSSAGEAGHIQINPLIEYSVDTDGTIYQDGNAVAQIGVVDVENYDYLEHYGENLYDLLDGGQIIPSEATVEQYALETSNYNIVDELVTMITIQRAYDAGQRMIRAEDETLEMAVNQVGRV